jgi:hypothetical protein
VVALEWLGNVRAPGVGNLAPHGKKGELHQRYRKGMEEQLATSGLVVNASVRWNTWSLQLALAQRQESEGVLNPDEVARTLPLLHINGLSCYDFTLPEAIAAGPHRLRTLTNWEAALNE